MYSPDTDTSKMTKVELRRFQASMQQRQKWNKDEANNTKREDNTQKFCNCI